MKIAVVMGTRPEIIRLYHTVKALPDKKIYWTGQNFEKNLSTDIFNDPLLKDAYKDVVMLSTGAAINFSTQFAKMIESLDIRFKADRPDKVLILGDTNSSLAGALIAKKNSIPLYHMEAGNRCYDPQSPEEVNRKLIDSIADVHMCYTKHAKQNLISEGVPQNRIHVIGNPMAEFSVLHTPSKVYPYILITCHRKENGKYIHQIIEAALHFCNLGWEVEACLHPRYHKKFIGLHPKLFVTSSIPFSDFIELEKEAAAIVTDSGTVCEEAAMLHVPCVIIRKTMERPELFDCGSVVLAGIKTDDIVEAITSQLNSDTTWEIPEEYMFQTVSLKVKNIVLSKGNYVITS